MSEKISSGRNRLERSYRSEDNIKMYIREVGCKCVDWIQLAQGSELGRTSVNIKCTEFIDQMSAISFSKKLLCCAVY
jgi:hypothetical protein